jgi:hypothetical protein
VNVLLRRSFWERHTHTHTEREKDSHPELEDTRKMKFPQLLYYGETHTQRRKVANFIYLFIFFCGENLPKSPPWKHTWWSKRFGKFPKKKLNRHISRRERKKSFEIAEICGGFGQIPSFLLLKGIYEGCANPNPLTPKEDDHNRTDIHLKYYILYICKVWDIRACHSICHNFLPTPRGKAKVWIWKHEDFVAIPSSEELFTKTLV